MTLEELRRVAKKVTRSPQAGCFDIVPSVRVRCIEAVPHNVPGIEAIKVGEILHVQIFDVEGHSPNHLRFQERCWWWPAEAFEIVS